MYLTRQPRELPGEELGNLEKIMTAHTSYGELNISYALNNAHTIEKIVELVNEGTCEGMEGLAFSSDELAGQYAHAAALESGDEVDAESIEAHLEFLASEGANFNTDIATAHALAIHAAKV